MAPVTRSSRSSFHYRVLWSQDGTKSWDSKHHGTFETDMPLAKYNTLAEANAAARDTILSQWPANETYQEAIDADGLIRVSMDAGDEVFMTVRVSKESAQARTATPPTTGPHYHVMLDRESEHNPEFKLVGKYGSLDEANRAVKAAMFEDWDKEDYEEFEENFDQNGCLNLLGGMGELDEYETTRVYVKVVV